MIIIRQFDFDGKLQKARIKKEDILSYLKSGPSPDPKNSFRNHMIKSFHKLVENKEFKKMNTDQKVDYIYDVMKSAEPEPKEKAKKRPGVLDSDRFE
jgi:hypothetical protein